MMNINILVFLYFHKFVLLINCDLITFSYTRGLQEFIVPHNVYKLNVVVNGASGGDDITQTGGKGATVTADISVLPGQKLYIFVGSAGTTRLTSSFGLMQGGFNGGGNSCGGGLYSGYSLGAGGGGASDIRLRNGYGTRQGRD